MSEISLIIRTYNEEKWIGECLRGAVDQTVKDFEVVLVDNNSTDKTVEKARNIHPDLTLVHVEDYLPGKALNKGIRESTGDFFVCLSAHCIPVDENWLETLRANFEEHDDVAGVYGRQVPTESSDPIDKRDLIRTFGPEKRIHTQDSFFHNANSMVRRDVWDEHPFDEEVTNIEDQIWAGEVLDEGYKTVYEPGAAVYHHHGIDQGNDPERTRSVVRTMEDNLTDRVDGMIPNLDMNPFDPTELDIVSFIPVRQKAASTVDTNEALIKETVDALQQAEYVDDTFVSTDSEHIAANAGEWGVTNTFIRPSELSARDINVLEVYRYTLEQLEAHDRYPDLVVTADITHPFRPTGFIDDIIRYLIKNGYDTVIPAYPENRPSWIERNGELQQLNDASLRQKRDPVQIGLLSLGTVMRPNTLREKDRLTGNLGIYEVDNSLAMIEIRERDDLKRWEKLRELQNKLVKEE